MKKIALASTLLCFLALSCKKGNDVADRPNSNSSNATAQTADLKPSAYFRIANLTQSGMILEANITDFQNLSQNAISWHWDFGNGVTSNEKFPQNISFAPCGGSNTITLTVSDRLGQTAVFSQAYTIQCRGKHARHAPFTIPLHLNTTQITALLQNL